MVILNAPVERSCNCLHFEIKKTSKHGKVMTRFVKTTKWSNPPMKLPDKAKINGMVHRHKGKGFH